MDATPLELSRAKAIKAAAQEAGLSPVSDFEYLQHAIVAKDKVQKALGRMRNLEEFRSKYNIKEDEDPEEALRLARAFQDKFPGFLVGAGQDSEGRAVQVNESRNFFPQKIEDEEGWRCLMAGTFHSFTALQPDVEAVRKGMLFLSDAGGAGLQNTSSEFQKRSRSSFQDSYPVRIEKIVVLDAPVIVC